LSKRTTNPIRSRAAALAVTALALGLLSGTAAFAADSGGLSSPSGGTPSPGSGTPGSAKLVDDPTGKCTTGIAEYDPSTTPPQIAAALDAGNRICDKPYIWGGGHGQWEDKGYDCSGTVSYLLHAAGLLNKPLDSGSLARLVKKRGKHGKKKWKKGIGPWITIAANGGHTYIDVDGLRMDTSSGPNGPRHNGPHWSTDPLLYNTSSYKILHPKKF
jgi:hypothetical protein